MKALIRKNDVVMECDRVDGINWNTGQPLTNPEYCGGPYTLVLNYEPPIDDEPVQYENFVAESAQVELEEEVVEDDDYVVIDGKRYSKEELRSLLE